MSEDSALAHLHLVGEPADRQPLQTIPARGLQSRLDNRSARQIALTWGNNGPIDRRGDIHN